MNEYQEGIADTVERIRSEDDIEAIRQQGGLFVEAVRLTRMPMVVTDATLPGNPITFANAAFIELSGYTLDELLGQDPHFMNGEETDPNAIRQYEGAIKAGRSVTLEIVQHRKDGMPFRAMLFASPLEDGRGTVTNHFLSYLDISRRHEAEENLRELTVELEERVTARTNELQLANERLKDLVAEREMLVVEVNHRAKNSLAIASALLGIQAHRQPDPMVKGLFEEAQDRLRSMAQVHDLLSRSEVSQQLDLEAYVGALCESLRPMTGNDDRIRLEAIVEARILIPADTAVPLGLVLTELVTNAMKYAFPDQRCGRIEIKAGRGEDGRIEVSVSDDGVGMSGGLREGSLGYGLVRSLVRQLGGRIDVRGDAGVTASISIPV